MNRTAFFVVSLAFGALMISGCDPEGPGARGTITLSSDVVVGNATSLEIRAFADSAGTFSEGDPIPPEAGCESETLSVPLSEVTFPYAYEIGCGIGISEHAQWEVVAFLATTAGQAAIHPGDWYGLRPFTVHACGSGFEGRCGITDSVDLEIGSQALAAPPN